MIECRRGDVWSREASIARRLYYGFNGKSVVIRWGFHTHVPVVVFSDELPEVRMDECKLMIIALEVVNADKDVLLAWYRLHMAMMKFNDECSTDDVIKVGWC